MQEIVDMPQLFADRKIGNRKILNITHLTITKSLVAIVEKSEERIKMKLHEIITELALPKLYETDGKEDAKYMVRITFGTFEWFLKEYSPEEKIAFGFANLNDPEMAELGYVSIAELESMKAMQEIRDASTRRLLAKIPVHAEIDEHFAPLTLEEVKKRVWSKY